MARLYCPKHGLEYARVLAGESVESFDGEGVAITKGKLKSDRWICDKCDVPLKEGEQAYYISFLTKDMAEDFGTYNFADEYAYFEEFDADEIELYGLEWPNSQ